MRCVLLLSASLLAAQPGAAQEVVQALPGTTDADALAADMRRLATNPRDIDALVDAAQLSLKLGDARAAAALLARADAADPRNGRVKAGQGSILVQAERPGEALRYFAQAEALGLDSRRFAADRALAYDLTGEQERAQRDYRVALRDRPGDGETIRRYALSLGISGQRARALALLDPLVRQSDRSAWRAQAFVLAMTGDVAGASRIAATMMPGGASGLAAFFARLPTLPATDRAFAVHFGEVRATPERLADARLAPTPSPLPREPGTATLLASNTFAGPRRNLRDRDRSRTQVVAAPAMPLPMAIRSEPPARTVQSVRAVQTPVASVVATSSPPPTPKSIARATSTPIAPATIAVAQVKSPAPAPTAIVGTTVKAPSAAPNTASPPIAVAIASPSAFIPLPIPSPVAAAPLSTGSAASPAVATASSPAAPPVAAPLAVPPRSLASTRASEDSILARIVAGLSIPASELGIEAPVRVAPVVEQAATPRPAVVAPDPAIVAKVQADRLAAAKLAAAKAATDKRAAERKALADKKALAEKKVAADKKALADKEAAEQKKVERSNPERIWVQVAGGAFEGDLRKAFAAVKAKAPAVVGDRQGWTTPLRATNRVLAGPFKSDAEARTFVNDLKKRGVSAFTFTSDPGQPVKRLEGK